MSTSLESTEVEYFYLMLRTLPEGTTMRPYSGTRGRKIPECVAIITLDSPLVFGVKFGIHYMRYLSDKLGKFDALIKDISYENHGMGYIVYFPQALWER